MRLFSASLLFLLPITSVAFAQTISSTPAAGDSTVTITVAPAVAGDIITILTASTAATCTASATVLPVVANSNTNVLSGPMTTVTLQDKLTQGEFICASITNAAGAVVGAITPAVTVGPPASPPGFDWHMVRAYFTFGALTSQERDQFSHEDAFLSFKLDKFYIPLKKVAGTTDTYRHFPSLDSFYEARMTALPVAVQSCTPNATANPPVTCASTGTTGASTTTTDAQTFLNSQKTVRLQFGLYAPVLLHQWHVTSRSGAQTISTPYALFAAPLVKTGFDTTLNGLNQTQQGSNTPNTVQPIGNSSEFYKFYDYGFRLGHYQMSSDTDTGPDEISYVDVTWGRFANLASLLCDTTKYAYDPGGNTCSPPSSSSTPIGPLPWQRDMRMNVEGLIHIPGAAGFSIGFSTNVVFDPFGHQGTGTLKHVRPHDDLRFLFAYKFDISTLFAKLAPQLSTK